MPYQPFLFTPPSDLWFGTTGPHSASIAIVGESWGSSEQFTAKPFQGESGRELDRMLAEAGYQRDDCFCTNVCSVQPPGNEMATLFHEKKSGVSEWRGLQPTPAVRSELERLSQQLEAVQPKVVIACGNYALWALTGAAHVSFGSISMGDGATVLAPTGIMLWRGSMLESGLAEYAGLKIIPIVHPAGVMRAWYLRAVTVHDLASRIPLALSGDWRPSPPPTVYATPNFEQAERTLSNWLIHAASGNLLRLSHDIETARGVITCMAFADGPYKAGSTALVIPFVRPQSDGTFENYWTADEELAISKLLVQLWTYPNVKIEGQNYNYDTQWIELFYGSRPNLDFDTMLAHHLLWPGTPKALDYISSLYNHYYWYWKDDNKEWDVKGNFEQHLRYNAEDALRTFECATELRAQIAAQGFEVLWQIEKEKNDLALCMMRRGVRIDLAVRNEMGYRLSQEKDRLNRFLSRLIPQRWLLESEFAPKTSKKSWWESPTQQKDLFFRILGFPSKMSRKTGNETLDAEAIEKLRKDVPWAARLWAAIESQRSIGVFKNTFIDAELEPNGRMKCSFNTAGTETFRWSSSTNAFWRGTNLQNIPKGEEDE